MADRLTQLQDAINMQAENLCNSVGILQQFAAPGKLSGLERGGTTPPTQEDYAQLFASLIARSAKDIDVLIESLPNEDSSAELQVQSLRKLEADNQDAADRLEQVVRRGERLLEQIQTALADIAQSQLDMERQQGNTPSNNQFNESSSPFT